MTPRLPSGIEDATHTVQRTIERQRTWNEILAVVAKPDKSVASHSGRINHYAVVNGRRLRVTIDAAGIIRTAAIAGRAT
jgi:hypothetical protein